MATFYGSASSNFLGNREEHCVTYLVNCPNLCQILQTFGTMGALSILCFKPSQLKPSNHLDTHRHVKLHANVRWIGLHWVREDLKGWQRDATMEPTILWRGGFLPSTLNIHKKYCRCRCCCCHFSWHYGYWYGGMSCDKDCNLSPIFTEILTCFSLCLSDLPFGSQDAQSGCP